MLDWKRSRSYLAAAALAASLGGCGNGPTETCPGGTTGTPPNCEPIVVVEPCTQTTVESDAGPIEGDTLYFNDFSVPDSGRLDITLDWTSPASAFGIFLVPVNTCSTLDEFNARSCNFLVRSEFATTPKPRKISVANFAAGNYRWLLGTTSDNSESVSYQFVLSKGSCAPLTGSQPSVSAQGAGVFHALTRAKSR